MRAVNTARFREGGAGRTAGALGMLHERVVVLDALELTSTGVGALWHCRGAYVASWSVVVSLLASTVCEIE